MFSIKRLIIFIIFFQYFISYSLCNTKGILTNNYGRISNINNKYIYVSASLTITDCIHQCTDFSINHLEFIFEDCFAYNYDMKHYTCELIHSTKPLNYTINFQSKWMTGMKYIY